MTDDVIWVDLERLNDWRRLAVNMIDGSGCVADFYDKLSCLSVRHKPVLYQNG